MDILTNWWFAVLAIVIVLLVWDAIDKSGRQYRAINKFPGPPSLPVIGTLGEILFMDQGGKHEVFSNNICSNTGLSFQPRPSNGLASGPNDTEVPIGSGSTAHCTC